jgi:hypothetical protein
MAAIRSQTFATFVMNESSVTVQANQFEIKEQTFIPADPAATYYPPTIRGPKASIPAHSSVALNAAVALLAVGMLTCAGVYLVKRCRKIKQT